MYMYLYVKRFELDWVVMIQWVKDVGISVCYLLNIDSEFIFGMMELEKEYLGFCFLMMGLYFCFVKVDYEQEFVIVKEWLEKCFFVVVGEIGIDLYWDKMFFE